MPRTVLSETEKVLSGVNNWELYFLRCKISFTILWNAMNAPRPAGPQRIAKVSKLISPVVQKSRTPSRCGDLILYGGPYNVCLLSTDLALCHLSSAF
jgi:hypothetical protein